MAILCEILFFRRHVKLTWFKRTQANCLDVRYNDKLLYKNLMLYVTSASGAFNVSFRIIFAFLIIPESILKLFSDSALTTVSGKLFHSVLTLLEKENLRIIPDMIMILSYFAYVTSRNCSWVLE